MVLTRYTLDEAIHSHSFIMVEFFQFHGYVTACIHTL